MWGLFRELQQYVGFTANDERVLRELHPRVQPFFPAISEVFYARVLEHANARAALTRGEKHVGQLKTTLVKWMNEVFAGPWDQQYVERRARIGRVHVEIALPQHYMVSAMNVMRSELRERIREVLPPADPSLEPAWRAVERICDLDLAMMLHTYREDLEASQVRAERLATYGSLMGSIGHELRNPLGVIETSLFVLKGRPSADDRTVKHLDRIGQQVSLANEIITQLLDLIRDRPLTRVPVDLVALVKESVDGATLVVPEAITIDADPIQLRQVLVNLAQNARQFAGPTGQVVVEVSRTPDAVTISVDDSGPGIDPSIRNRLFEPLVTTRTGGIGLGLALVKRIVEGHGGTVAATRGSLGGARFTIVLPTEGATA